jgi:hypothetical protein
MWGIKNWGELIWGGSGAPIPLLSPPGLLVLAVLLLGGAVVVLRRRHSTLAITLSAAVLVIPLAAYAGSVMLPNTFTNGTIADADQVNANFSALAGAVNDNDTRIGDLSSVFGVDTSRANAGSGSECTLGQVWLTAGVLGSGVPAEGQILSLQQNTPLYSLLGTLYGGDGSTSFGLPDLRDAAPNGLTYVICIQGAFPQPL